MPRRDAPTPKSPNAAAASSDSSHAHGREHEGGRFRIATVAELTGVPEPTLRAWERRYGVPAPERTASGYRLYGEAEVEQVREMRRLCDEGMAPAEAARVLRSRAAAGERAASSPGGPLENGENGDGTDPYALARESLLAAVERFDDLALDHELRRVFYLGNATQILDRVLAPALVEIGERWHAGEISVAHEHFATQKLGTVIRNLIPLLPGSDAETSVVLASFADDEHELGALGVALRVSEWGMRPVFLGARTPPTALRSAVEAVAPRLVGLSVTVTPSRARARELVEEYARAVLHVPWVVGGKGAEPIAELVEKHGGKVVLDGAADLSSLVRPLLSPASRLPIQPVKKGGR